MDIYETKKYPMLQNYYSGNCVACVNIFEMHYFSNFPTLCESTRLPVKNHIYHQTECCDKMFTKYLLFQTVSVRCRSVV